MTPEHAISLRLTRHLSRIAREHPGVWDQVADFRTRRRELGDWPDWCFLPLAGAYAIASRGGSLPHGSPTAVAEIGALASWRATQGIYRFDATLLDALWHTDLTGEIPVEVLHRMPEWCVYLWTPGRRIGAFSIVGAWAHLEYDANDHRTELRILLDTEGGALLPIILHVWVTGGIGAAVDRAAAEAEFQARAAGITLDSFPLTEIGLHATPLVNLLLYLCTDEAEIRGAKNPDRRPSVRFPAAPTAGHSTVWDAGYHLGPALRRAIEHTRAEPQGGGHASPRPHVRRGHWHGYWTGPRSASTLRLKWLAPVAVGIGDISPTVRPIEADE